MTSHRSQLISVLFVLLALLASGCGDDASTQDAATTEAADAAGIDDADTETTADNSDDAGDDAEGVADAADDASGDEDTDAAAGPDAGGEIVVPEFDDRTKPEVPFTGEKLSELTTTDLLTGEGPVAEDGSLVDVHYVGVLNSDGTEFDASWERAQPFQFVLGTGSVISGWDQGVAGMQPGGRRVISIPSDLAYGDTARGDIIGADADLVFVVDLHCVTSPGDPDGEPELAVPDALPDELLVEDLVEGTGDASVEGDVIQMEFTSVFGSTGEKFASTWDQGAMPAQFLAGGDSGIAGLDQGLVGVKAGGTRQLTIPADLAFGPDGLPGPTVTDPPQVAPDETIIIRFNVVAINPC